jgi:hypothetical protein
MSERDTTIEFTVPAAPDHIFDAVVDVRAWWTGDITGPTDEVGAEFTYRHEGVHRSVQRVTALEPGRRVAWHVVEGYLDFVQDTQEWTGTDVVFEISPVTQGSTLRFTHVGLSPRLECFDACSGAWQYYVGTALRALILSRSAPVA